MEAVDLVALLLDASEDFGQGDRRAVERVQRFEGKRFLLLNKIDRVPKTDLLPRIETLAKMGTFDEIIPISALKGDGVDLTLLGAVAGWWTRPAMGRGRNDPATWQCLAGAESAAVPALPVGGLRAAARQPQPMP